MESVEHALRISEIGTTSRLVKLAETKARLTSSPAHLCSRFRMLENGSKSSDSPVSSKIIVATIFRTGFAGSTCSASTIVLIITEGAFRVVLQALFLRNRDSEGLAAQGSHE